MNKLLIDDYPIQVLPKLATEIGLNEAIILQQIHYWLNKSDYYYDGKKWIYNSYKEWQKQFPFWSNATIRRTISSLEKQNLLFTGNFNKTGFDKTKWYSINYEALEGLSKRVAQNEQRSCSKPTNRVAQNEQTYTRDLTETTSETTYSSGAPNNPKKEKPPYKQVIDYLNEKVGKNYGYNAKETRKHISGRFNEGNTLDDFKHVIDVKVADWLDDEAMKTYLQPKTLFNSSNFDKYKNETIDEVEARKKHWKNKKRNQSSRKREETSEERWERIMSQQDEEDDITERMRKRLGG